MVHERGERYHKPKGKTPRPNPYFSLLYWQRLEPIFESSDRSAGHLPTMQTSFHNLSLTAAVFFAFVTQRLAPLTEESKLQNPQSSREAQLPEAIEKNQKALLRQPGNERIELALADTYRRVHNDEQARAILQTARRQHPRSIAILRAIATLEIDTQNYDASISALRSALVLAPSNTDIKTLLATAYLKKGNADAALGELNGILSHSSNDALTHFIRAQIYADRGENEESLADLEKVIAVNPQYPPARTLYTKVLVRLAKCQRALEILRPSQQQSALDADSLFLLATAYDCAGQKDQASQARGEFEMLSRAQHETAENRVQSLHLVEQANELAMHNQFSEAQAMLQQALEKNPENAFAYSQQAKIYFSIKQTRQARAAITKALELQPYQPDFLFVQGVIEAGDGNLEAALASFHAVTLINPQEADAYFEVGKIFLQKNDRPRALAAFQKAAQLSPGDDDYRQAVHSAKTHP